MTVRTAMLAAGMLLIAATAHPLRAQTSRDSSSQIALTGVTLIDGTGHAPERNETILTKGERIVAVFPDGAHPLPAGVTVLKLTGRFVIPGLIDSHVHIATDPSGEDNRLRTERRLRKALLGGVTTVRDMAGDTRALASLQRDALLGEIESPDIYFAALFSGPAFFADPRTHAAARGAVAGQVPWMRAITDTTDIHQAVAEARGTGATAIKLYAELNGDLARRITTEAHAQGLMVWAHASLTIAMPMDVVTAGADAISHAPLLARAMDSTDYRAALHAPASARLDIRNAKLDAVLREMIRRHTVFEPTLFIFQAEEPSVSPLGAAVTRRAHELGVTIIAGTDTLGDADSDQLTLPYLHNELALLVSVGGLNTAEALASATRNAAAVVGAESSIGTIEPGKLADIVVLRSDPLRDIRNTRSIELVIKRGRVYRRQG
jgi:imidazolonepropionase-like amidohydrolase